jgi:hypothetical protein
MRYFMGNKMKLAKADGNTAENLKRLSCSRLREPFGLVTLLDLL